MVICSLDALKKSSKKKETIIKKEIVEMLQQASHRRKRTGKLKIAIMKFLALTLYLLAKITQGFNLVICNFDLPSAFLYASCELFER